MIIDYTDTTTSQIARELVRLREEGGAVALGRVLTLLVISDGGGDDEQALQAAIQASGEHPMRVIMLIAESSGDDRLDAQVRIGSDAGASDIIVLRAWGQTASDPETLVQALLLPDAPIVGWWTQAGFTTPAESPLGRIAQLRIIDTSPLVDGLPALERLAAGFQSGDSNLAWTRLTMWRAQLAAVLDQPPYEPVLSAVVEGRRGSTGAILFAAWLHHYLQIPVDIVECAQDENVPSRDLRRVVLNREAGEISLERISRSSVALTQPGQPIHVIPMPLRETQDVLAEELRSLTADEIYRTVLIEGVPELCVDGVCNIGPRR